LVIAILIVPLVRAEEAQPVLDQGPAGAQAHEVAAVVGFRRARGTSERIQRNEVLVLIGIKGVPGPFVSARLRGRRDDCAGGLLILGFVVLRENPVLLHRIPWARVAAAAILAHRPAMDQVVLVAGPVDEQVGLVGPLRTG